MEASAGDTAMREENISSNKDYLKDWKIDFATKSATHVTGLTFKYIEEGLDGQEKIEVQNLSKWFQFCKTKYPDMKQRLKLQSQLQREFWQICQDIIRQRREVSPMKFEHLMER